jgi:hypothetical protein
MQMGLLWFDDDPRRELVSKVEEAARRYQSRFGVVPDTCYVNRAVLSEGDGIVRLQGQGNPTLRLAPASNIPLHHFWVGVEDRFERVVP